MGFHRHVYEPQQQHQHHEEHQRTRDHHIQPGWLTDPRHPGYGIWLPPWTHDRGGTDRHSNLAHGCGGEPGRQLHESLHPSRWLRLVLAGGMRPMGASPPGLEAPNTAPLRKAPIAATRAVTTPNV